MNVDQKLLETEFSIAICCLTKIVRTEFLIAIENTVSSNV